MPPFHAFTQTTDDKHDLTDNFGNFRRWFGVDLVS